MKILVAIANYGAKNDPYLRRTLAEYRGMREWAAKVDIVVLSNLSKDLGPDVEVRVGIPGKDPHTLPFAHKKLFGERRDAYDLYIYAEDDILITRKNIDAFLRATAVLPENEIAGFTHADTAPDGTLYYDPLHMYFHWDPDSVCTRGEYTCAFFTNEHTASFLLTRAQLHRAIASGGFLVEPHVGRYNWACSASTDPYTQCGFRKMVCVSHLDEFTVLHLPNNKVSLFPFRHAAVYHRQIQALLDLRQNGRFRGLLFEPETKVIERKWSKDYYEPCREDMLALLPPHARSVLSLGCGFGYTEEALVKKGIRVVAVPIDAIIGACAADKGIEIVCGDFQTVREKLAAQRFDGILMSNFLHLTPDPPGVLSSFVPLLAPQGRLVASAPNFRQVTTQWRRLRRLGPYKDLGDYAKTGIHLTSHAVVRNWFRASGLTVLQTVDILPEKARLPYRLSCGLAGPLLARELLVAGERR